MPKALSDVKGNNRFGLPRWISAKGGFPSGVAFSTNLGAHESDATDRFHYLMREPNRKPVKLMSFAAIADAFLDWVHSH